jgi:hypothetical protein
MQKKYKMNTVTIVIKHPKSFVPPYTFEKEILPKKIDTEAPTSAAINGRISKLATLGLELLFLFIRASPQKKE